MGDMIERQAAIEAINALHDKPNAWLDCAVEAVEALPSAQPKLKLVDITDISEIFEPKFTEEEIQMMQELEAAEIEKAYQLDMPSARPEPKWIPVSERLPHGSCSDLVNVSIHDDSGDTPFDYTSCGWVTTDGEYWIVDNEINNHVIAWMPLPEPYRGDE